MSRVFVIRNNALFGPYELNALAKYFEEGKILASDNAFFEGMPKNITTVRAIIKQSNFLIKIRHAGNIYSQFKDIGSELIFPNDLFSRKAFFKDTRLLILAILGLCPAFLIRFTFIPFITFYTISLYFSTIWGLFFFHFFKTNQVKISKTILLFFALQLCVFILWDILSLPYWPVINVLYSWTDSSFVILRFLGFVLGVGVIEELVKALPLFFIVRKAHVPIIPQTLVFYGLMSGIAFGVFEGVQYQMTVNTQLDYSNAFFMNIARLTSLPFLHAIWAGISGYFIAFANLYPKYRRSLYLLSIALPAFLHGLYDTLGWNIIGLSLTLINVILLISYLKQGINFQSKLSK